MGTDKWLLNDGDGNPFVENIETGDKLTRSELEPMSGPELAKIAYPKQNRYQLNTLKSKKKEYLIDIILGIIKEEKPTQGRAPQSQSESHNIVDTVLAGLEALKGAPINEEAKNMLKLGAVNKVDDARAEGVINQKLVSNAFLGIGAVMVAVDVIGQDNIKKGYEIVKSKFAKPKAKAS